MSFESVPFPLQILCNSGHLTFVPLGDLPKSVEHLSLTNNNLSYLATDAFVGLRHLRKLTLDGNGIRAIERFAFRGLPRLRELSVQHTPLGSLKKFSFAGLQNVTAILLGYNQISVIDEFAFAGTANIRLILLNNNPLHTVSEATMGVLTPSVCNSFTRNCGYGRKTTFSNESIFRSNWGRKRFFSPEAREMGRGEFRKRSNTTRAQGGEPLHPPSRPLNGALWSRRCRETRSPG